MTQLIFHPKKQIMADCSLLLICALNCENNVYPDISHTSGQDSETKDRMMENG
jgi:hypothetical protein